MKIIRSVQSIKITLFCVRTSHSRFLSLAVNFHNIGRKCYSWEIRCVAEIVIIFSREIFFRFSSNF